MSRTTFSGPIKAGNIAYNTYKNVGSVVLQQNVTFDFAAGDTVTTGTNADRNVYLPAGSKILEIYIDHIVSFAYATGAIALTIGKTSGGTDYAPSTALVTAGAAANTGRLEPTFTQAQLIAFQSTSSDISSTVTGTFPVSKLVVTLAASGGAGANTAGKLNIIIKYSQPDDRSAFSAQ